MKKLTDFIVEKRKIVLTIFLIVTLVCAIISLKVNINYDISKYLPRTSETRIGLDISESEFENNSSSFKIAFKGLDTNEKQKIYETLKNIDGVESINYDDSEKHNKDDYTMYEINVSDSADSKVASSVFKKVEEQFKNYQTIMSGDIMMRNTRVLPLTIVGLAIFCALIILIIMCESYIEPFLFLTAIGLAVFLNKGTNVMFDSVSNITDSICAILQMALSMDYSIMLINRYRQERVYKNNKEDAMKEALNNAFTSISSSSITTVVGLIALVFMSFTIGRDLGFVLAKGVIFSLISIFFFLPGLILMFDNLINKTKKKSPIFNLNKTARLSYKLRYVSFTLFIILFGVAYLLKGNLNIIYSNTDDDEVGKIFKDNNQMAIIYNNIEEKKISKYCKSLENNNKIDSVLCYGNTIGEELKYDEVNKKLSDLGSNTTVDDYLLKIIYYNYYNKEYDKLTFEEFINFIKKEVYDNDTIKESITDEMKDNIDLLSNFTTNDGINKKRTIGELSDILNIDEESIKNILVYYGSFNNNTTLTINEFIDFIKSDVLTNPTYSKNLTSDAIANINKLSKFTNINTINKKLNYKEMASLLEIDENTTNNLYLYYTTIKDVQNKMSLNEFSNFVLSNISSIDENTMNSIKLLNLYSDKNFINTNVNISALSSYFSIPEEKVKQILLFKYLNIDTNEKMNISTFITGVNYLKNNTNYLDATDISLIDNLTIFANGSITNEKMNKEALSDIFSDTLVSTVYVNLSDDYLFTPLEFVNYTITNYNSYLDSDTLKNLNFLKIIMEDSINKNYSYTSSELSNLICIDKNSTVKIYNLINYINDNTNYKATPYEFVNMILNTNEISSNLDDNVLQKLNLLNTIMNNIDNTFTYEEMSTLLKMDKYDIKSIYALYTYDNKNLLLTPLEFINFLLNNQNSSVLKGKIDTNNLNLVKTIMEGVVNNKSYTSYELSNITGTSKDSLDLLYSLYNVKKTSPTISLKELINFIVNNIITNDQYKDNFDNNSIKKLTTINGIINSGNTKYTKDEMIAILSNLTDNVDKKMIDLLYIYYGSNNDYNDNWTLTVEKFINYINDVILTDERFSSFIDDDMKKNVESAKSDISEAKKLLVGSNYSRIVLNTSYEIENDEVYNFVSKVKDDLNDAYIIGNSPMSYEMSKTFNSELNLITILTMIFIFIVVAITFKSITIPIILILAIQCSVYITMSILSLAHEDVYFIALLIVQSILMGATIDYAILYTTYYVENRKTKNKIDSVITSYNKSLHTILTSASILIIVTLIVGQFASATAAKICKTLSEGTICSTILILVLLPGVLSTLDKFIIKKI